MQKAVTYFIQFLICFFICIHTCSAANWAKLNENTSSKLMIDKQSILEKDNLKRAWVKIEYKTIQKNIESSDTQYDLSKLLWYFDCPAQKAAATQVFQYLHGELVHSAGIDNVKNAKFIEPVPESEFDRAMHYVCTSNRDVPPKSVEPSKTGTPNKSEKEPKSEAKQQPADTKNKAPEPQTTEAKPSDSKSTEKKPAEKKPAEKTPTKKAPGKPDNKKTEEPKKPVTWSYEGKESPEHWGKLSEEFSMCSTGKTQSPVDITDSIDANLKPLKLLQKFPAKEVLQTNHSIQLNFKDGNIIAIDNTTYKLKQANFHTPSEHSIQGKSFPLEAQFLHTDGKGNTVILAVLFKEGRSHYGLNKLLKQLPSESNKPVTLQSKLLASEMIPSNQDYYLLNGSLTTPPCTEGVRWVVIKTPMPATKKQIEALSELTHKNNRPLQPANNRLIVD